MSRTDRSAEVLAFVRAFATKGMRCPTNVEIAQGLGAIQFEDTLPQLAQRGLCRVEIYGRNWRVVEIDGFRTAPHPKSLKPWAIYEKVPA